LFDYKLVVAWEELMIGNIKVTAFDLNGGHAEGNIATKYFH
jgi:hypothetical protein